MVSGEQLWGLSSPDGHFLCGGSGVRSGRGLLRGCREVRGEQPWQTWGAVPLGAKGLLLLLKAIIASNYHTALSGSSQQARCGCGPFRGHVACSGSKHLITLPCFWNAPIKLF